MFVASHKAGVMKEIFLFFSYSLLQCKIRSPFVFHPNLTNLTKIRFFQKQSTKITAGSLPAISQRRFTFSEVNLISHFQSYISSPLEQDALWSLFSIHICFWALSGRFTNLTVFSFEFSSFGGNILEVKLVGGGAGSSSPLNFWQEIKLRPKLPANKFSHHFLTSQGLPLMI